MAAFIAALCLGPVTIAPSRIQAVLMDALAGRPATAGYGLRERIIIMDVRLPRAVLGVLVILHDLNLAAMVADDLVVL